MSKKKCRNCDKVTSNAIHSARSKGFCGHVCRARYSEKRIEKVFITKDADHHLEYANRVLR